MNKTTTIYDLSKLLKVSPSTVSRALNNRGRMSNETRQRIVDVARQYAYQPSLAAQSLVQQRTSMLGIIVPMIGDSVYSQMVRGVEQVAFEHNFNIILCDTDIDIKREREYLDMLIRRRVEGIIVVPFANGEKLNTCDSIQQIESFYAIPLVVMEEELPGARLTQVMAGTCEATKLLVNHLIKLGHKRIAFFRYRPESWDANAKKRFQGYHEALLEAGLSYDPELVLDVGYVGAQEDNLFYPQRVESFLEQMKEKDLTAICAMHDRMAAKSLLVIHKMGLKVPEDLAIVGFDDIDIASISFPKLTTMRQPACQIGRRAAELLFERIKFGNNMQWPVHETIPCDLVVRDSCGGRKCQ